MPPIDKVQVQDRSLGLAQAEVWITVLPHWTTQTLEVRGKLTGPHCSFISTVQVAYPLRPLLQAPADLVGITSRVVIPDPSLWEPARPYLYQGVVELRDAGKLQDQAQVRHGLRFFNLSNRGLRLNGQLLTVQGYARVPASEADAKQLREAGANFLLVPSTEEHLWGLADRLGFLMLGRVDLAVLDAGVMLRGHPVCLGSYASAFGSLLPESSLARPSAWWDSVVPGLKTAGPPFLGVELTRVPNQALPRQIDWVLCEEGLLPRLTEVRRPILVLGNEWGREDALPPGVFGWIRQ